MYHQVIDASAERYEVPVPLNLPTTPGNETMYDVSVGEIGQPFSLSITRTSNGASV